MSRVLDITGQRFGRLVAMQRTIKRRADAGTSSLWVCKCDCGKEHIVYLSSLRAGLIRSCGCLHTEIMAACHHKHGHGASGRKTTTYITWRAMLTRCFYPNSKTYSYYGGRGISVCQRWMEFKNFLSDMGERPDGKTIDRIDNYGNYEPDNCRWATRKEQSSNQRPRRRSAA